ncbi:MAG: hypothetical protein L0H93_12230 [Nocardioides sp.]|nr:hypothetical protein [Nocardioides sp.]
MSAELIRDEPAWPMPSLTPTPSLRRLRVWRLPDGGHVALITERGPGTSVTNVAERAYAAVRRDHPRTRVFEHYPAQLGILGEEHFDEITVVDGKPIWSPWPPAAIATWLGKSALEDPFTEPTQG